MMSTAYVLRTETYKGLGVVVWAEASLCEASALDGIGEL